MAWHKTIHCLDEDYCTFFYHFCHCTQGLHKFMVTCIDNVSIQGHYNKVKECQANAFRAKISFPMGKLIIDLL